jgi:hypothetical protein
MMTVQQLITVRAACRYDETHGFNLQRRVRQDTDLQLSSTKSDYVIQSVSVKR